MRKIKFRGKRLDNGVWVYGSLIIFDANSYFIFQGHKDTNNLAYDQLLATLMIMVDPKSIGQYTGLKDKNNMDIYEGDIAWDYYSETYGQVVFDDNGFRYKCEDISDDLSDVCLDIKCIDNIHENPELLDK